MAAATRATVAPPARDSLNRAGPSANLAGDSSPGPAPLALTDKLQETARVLGEWSYLMPRRARLLLLLASTCLCSAGPRPSAAADDFAFHHENVMGTSLELRVVADHAEAAR